MFKIFWLFKNTVCKAEKSNLKESCELIIDNGFKEIHKIKIDLFKDTIGLFSFPFRIIAHEISFIVGAIFSELAGEKLFYSFNQFFYEKLGVEGPDYYKFIKAAYDKI